MAVIIEVGEYYIPDDCTAKIAGRHLVIQKHLRDIDSPKCRDCKFCIKGKHTLGQTYLSKVCQMKPKKLKCTARHEELFYSVTPHAKPCERFIHKEKE